MNDLLNPTVLVAIGCMLLVAAVGFCVSRKKKPEEQNKEKLQTANVSISEKSVVELQNDQNVELSIKFEDLPALTEAEDTRLVEIHDNQLLAKVDNVIPGTLKAIANAGAIHQYNQAVKSAGQLYRAIIPNGAVLTNSREMQDAVRGFYRGAKNIKGQANLIAVDGDMGKGLATMGAANAVMGVASMVVGQYYMDQINNKLEAISKDIKQIAGFQDNEYKSKIYALIAEVQKSSQFRIEIMDNEELRNRELIHIESLEHECAELLGQANLTLQDCAKKQNLSYEEYEKAVSEANKWYQYQQILLEIMGEIGELIYALNLGSVSKEFCHAMYTPFAKQAEDTLVLLNEWHKENTKRLEIDIQAERRKRQGVEGFFMGLPALFNDDLNYKGISKNTVHMIDQQSHVNTSIGNNDNSDYFQEDVKLIAKEGKLYYLPPAEGNTIS